MSDAPCLLRLPNDLFRHVASFLTDLEHGPFAASCTAALAVVRAHRHGVVLALRSRRPPQRDFVAAFALKIAEAAALYTAPREGGARIYDLKLCLPIVLRYHGGWAGVAAARARQMQTAERKRKREEAAAAERAARRQRVEAALRCADVVPSLDELEARLKGRRVDVPSSLESYVWSKGSLESALMDLVRVAQETQREREFHAWCSMLPPLSPETHDRVAEYIWNGGKGKALVELLTIAERDETRCMWREAAGLH